MNIEIRNKKIKSTKALLQLELNRISELLNTEVNFNLEYSMASIKSELKAKMHEARRDMIRLEKLLYDYEYDEI